MAAAPVAGGVSQADALDGAAIIGRELLTLAGHAQVGLAKLGGQALGALADFHTKATAVNGFLGQKRQSMGRTKGRFNANLLLGQHAHLIHFHHRAHSGTKADGIDPFFVTQHGGVLQGLQVFHAVGRTECPSRFVFKAARSPPILGFVGHREVTLVHLADATTRDRATKAGLVGDQLLFAVGGAGRGHGFSRDVFGALKRVVAVVAGGQRAHLVDDVHQHLGTVSR